MANMNYETIASELLCAIRGKRSQAAFSRRLGYRSNVAHSWESGRAYPTAAAFFRICERVGIDSGAPVSTFYRVTPPRLESVALTQPEGVAALLADLASKRSISDIAHRAGRSRFAVSRWIKGVTEPRLPDFLLMVETTSFRLLDFVASLVDPKKLRSVAAQWERLEAARRAAYDMPWSHAVLRVLELAEYRSLEAHEPGWIASRLGIPVDEEKRCLELLASTRQIRRRRRLWVPSDTLMVDTRRDFEKARDLKAFWSTVAVNRLRAGAGGTFAYNLFCVSRTDLERIRALHTAFFRELRAIVAQSEPAECVALVTTNMLALKGVLP